MSANPIPPMKILRCFAIALLLATPAGAQSPSTDSLLKGLETSLRQPSKAVDPEAANRMLPYLPVLRNALAAHNYAEAGRILTSLGATPLGSTEPIAGSITQLQAALRAEAAAATAARDAEIDAIVAEIRGKFSKRAPAADYDSLLGRVAKLSATPAPYDDQSRVKLEGLRMFVMRWQDYLLQTSQGNWDQAANSLTYLVDTAGSQGIVPRSELAALQAETKDKAAAARASQGGLASARLQVLTQKAQAAVESAKSPADLDALLAELGRPLYDDPNIRGNLPSNVAYQYDSLRRYVLRWQDYLAQLEAGNPQAATNALRELSNDSGASNLIPRSRLLALIDGKAPGKGPPAAVETLVPPEELTPDTLDKFILQLNSRSDRIPQPGMEDAGPEAVRLRAAYGQLKLGNPFPAINVGNTAILMGRFGPYAFALARVQQTIVVRALPSYVEAPPDLTAADSEPPLAYLQRVVRRGVQTKDWQLVYRALRAAQQLNQRYNASLGNDWTSLDIAGYQFFFQAMNEERAGQWTTAVRIYLMALQTSGPDLPAEEIGNRLAQLKSSHPQDYDLAQRQPDYRGLPPGLPPGVMIAPGIRPDQPVPLVRPAAAGSPAEADSAASGRPAPASTSKPADASGPPPAKTPDASSPPTATPK